MKKNKKGFTLVELVIVVAVMAVLIAVAVPTVSSITKTAQKTVADTNARTIESTLKLKEAELSKEGDGTVELEGDDIAEALNEAKLGIESGSYVYDPEFGTVTAIYDSYDENETPNAAEVGQYTITFTDGEATAELKEAAPAPTPDPDPADPADPENP